MQLISVESVGMTVADMERSLDFYTTVLSCKKISDNEVTGVECDRLYGLSNVRLRVAKLKLGNETIELTEFFTPKDRSIPPHSGIDHTAIVVANTAASRAFYCDRLSMTLQQESLNFGLEQEHLSGISGVKCELVV